MSHLTGDNKKLMQRVRRIKGQVEGLERMLEASADCHQVLQTTAACRGALNALTRELIEQHLIHHIEEDEGATKSIKNASHEVRDILKSYLK